MYFTEIESAALTSLSTGTSNAYNHRNMIQIPISIPKLLLISNQLTTEALKIRAPSI